MDRNSTGRQRAPSQGPPPPPKPSGSAPPSGASIDRRVAVVLAGVLIVALAAGIALGGILSASLSSATFGASSPAETSPTPAAVPSATNSATTASNAATNSASPTRAPSTEPLPALLAGIGDSYTQAWSVSPEYLYDHPQFSWVYGTDKNDGVTSLLERFEALGGSPQVVRAATSGRKMSDAPRQADLVVAAAEKLGPGRTAYVTFELGINDLCASPDPMTDPTTFETALQTAVATLRAGLPAGSRILMLPVPDFPHLRDITQRDPTAKAHLALPRYANVCAPYLGASSPAAIATANDYLARYDASLKAACDDIAAHEGTTGRLHCTYNAALLADSDFTIGDLSGADYFHPSLSGQAKMARNAWAADVWASAAP
jgi:lysophospholipase L1-like esterase